MSGGPLAGVRVLELAGLGPGPFAAMLLADLGADVVRVDRPGGPRLAVVPPEQDLLGRGKRSVCLDLASPDDVARLLALVGRTDLLIEGFRPGVAERLGVGPDQCLARAPRLVYGRMTGWGQDGPDAHVAGHDLTYVAVTGALHAIGRPGEAPAVPLNLLGDFAGGVYLVAGLLAALHESRASGVGQVVDAAMVDSSAHLMTMFYGLFAAGAWQDVRGANLLDGGAPFYDVYATADGRHMAVGALEKPFFQALLAGLGIDPAEVDRADVAAWPALRGRLAQAFAARTQAEWVAVFAGTDACVAPVLGLGQAHEHPHLVARGTFVEHLGVVQPAPAPRFSRTPGALDRPPPAVGQHTAEVLADWLR
ncbi:MAG: alpha-methylacyl-CoA racemase [Actinomycetota bacterium]|nr:alpha-methylacyl-CoA racemase [Actinomycetota bacterium]